VSEVKIGDLTITPFLNKTIKSIHPAIGLVDDTAYVGVWVPCEIVGKKGATNEDLLWIVTDRREMILANDETLRGRGWRLAYRPIHFQNRWSLSYVQSYLKGEVTVTPSQLLTNLVHTWKENIDFPDEKHYWYHSLWDTGSYFHHIFNAFPYLYIGGVKGVGKTKALSVHACLAFNAIFSNNMSVSSLYRLIQNMRSTLLIDETEKLSNPDRALDFRSILLGGYKKGEKVYRVEKTRKETLQPEEFEVYSPKGLANIRGLEDVLEDRCHLTWMRKGRDRKVIDREVDLNDPKWAYLRSQLYIFYLQYWRELKKIYDEISVGSVGSEGVKLFYTHVSEEKLKVLTGRELELWKPILTLAIFFDKHCAQKSYTPSQPTLLTLMLEMAVSQAEAKKTESMTETGEAILVQVLANAVTRDNYYKVKEIRNIMADRFDDEQTWLRSEWVSRALRRLGFSEKRRVGKGVEYRLTVKDVRDLAERMGVSFGFGVPDENVIQLTQLPAGHPAEKCEICGQFPVEYEFLYKGQKLKRCQSCVQKLRDSGVKFTTIKEE
jgi:hypothetical protein